jgi:hypothetical protein
MIIALGQGNLETLSEESWGKPLFIAYALNMNSDQEMQVLKIINLILLENKTYKRYF